MYPQSSFIPDLSPQTTTSLSSVALPGFLVFMLQTAVLTQCFCCPERANVLLRTRDAESRDCFAPSSVAYLIICHFNFPQRQINFKKSFMCETDLKICSDTSYLLGVLLPSGLFYFGFLLGCRLSPEATIFVVLLSLRHVHGNHLLPDDTSTVPFLPASTPQP